MVTSSVTNTVLARKWLAQKLIALAELQLVHRPLCDEVKLDRGMGKTANFAKVARADLPAVPLSEGVDPSESAFPAITNVAVTVEQWGAFFTLTDVTELTTSHPMLQIATERLADVAARLIDVEIGKVFLGGTQSRLSNGAATRDAIAAADVMNETELHTLRTTLEDVGAPPRTGANYDLVLPPQVCADLMRATANYATWAGSVAKDNPTAFESADVGSVLGFRIIKSNYLPYFQSIGGASVDYTPGQTIAGVGVVIDEAAGGTFAQSKYGVKVTRIDKQRGYESVMTTEHGFTPSAGSKKITLACPATAGYRYNFYITGSGLKGTTLYLVNSVPAEPSETVTVSAPPSSGAQPPADAPLATSGTGLGTKVYVGFAVAKSAVNLVAFQNLQATLTPKEESESNPLGLRRKVGFKFMMKAGRRDETRLIRWEGPASY